MADLLAKAPSLRGIAKPLCAGPNPCLSLDLLNSEHTQSRGGQGSLFSATTPNSEDGTSENPWTRRVRDWGPAALLAIATLLAYSPCLQGEFVWDDDAWTLKLSRWFQSLSGLGVIWTHLNALQQYYPLTATTFWLDYQLWRFWTLPYHLENILLHLTAVFLFWQLLRRLQVRGAGLAAAILALHPLMVESVAWITERKNVLSLALFLAALLSYGPSAGFWRDDQKKSESGGNGAGPRKWRAYGLAFGLFAGAYLAKATAISFPAVVLLICWWKRGRLRWRTDVLPTLPFFAFSLALGMATFLLERNHLGAKGPEWGWSFPERCLIAGRALWFYVGKLLWPANLCFVYPRWTIDVRSAVEWLYPVGAVACLTMLWLERRRLGRGPLTALLFYCGTLFPLLGFFNAYFMRYSFACDHWAYLPSLGLIALGAALLAALFKHLPNTRLVPVLSGAMLFALAILTFRQSGMYSDSETLYQTILRKNPNADLAHNNLGILYARAGELERAIPHFRRALEIRPNSAHAHNNLANALRLTGEYREAASNYEASLKLEPGDASTWINVGMLLASCPDPSVRDGKRAVELAQKAKDLTRGANPVALATLACAYAEAGRFPEAVSEAEAALRLAVAQRRQPLANVLQAQLELYRAGSPYHEAPAQAEPGVN